MTSPWIDAYFRARWLLIAATAGTGFLSLLLGWKESDEEARRLLLGVLASLTVPTAALAFVEVLHDRKS